MSADEPMLRQCSHHKRLNKYYKTGRVTHKSLVEVFLREITYIDKCLWSKMYSIMLPDKCMRCMWQCGFANLFRFKIVHMANTNERGMRC